MNRQDIVCVARRSLSEKCDYYPCEKYGLEIELSDEKGDASGFCTELMTEKPSFLCRDLCTIPIPRICLRPGEKRFLE